MKTLNKYIKESINKSITFDLTDLDDAQETIDSIKALNNKSININNMNITVNVNKNNIDSFTSFQDIMQQYCEIQQNSQKATTYEIYAQKINNLNDQLSELNDLLDEYSNEEE